MVVTMNKLIGSSTTTTTALFTTTTTKTTTSPPPPPSVSFSSKRRSHVIVSATGKFTPRTGKFDSKNRRGGSASTTTTTTTTTKDELTRKDDNIGSSSSSSSVAAEDEGGVVVYADDGFVRPELPGDKPDFWEGPQWDAVGFFVQYMWAFGVVFALAACGVAVATYNEGATDFKETPAYKESIQSQDLLEGPEASNSDVFESNPTEEAPALE